MTYGEVPSPLVRNASGHISEESKAELRHFYEFRGWGYKRLCKAVGIAEENLRTIARTQGWTFGGVPKPEARRIASEVAVPVIEAMREGGSSSDDFRQVAYATPEATEVPPVEQGEPDPGEAMRLANRMGAGLRYQIGVAHMVTQARMCVIPTTHGVQMVPIDVSTYDPETKTFALWDGTRIGEDRTVPDYDRRAKGLQLLMKVTGSDSMGAAEGAMARVRGKRRIERLLAQDATLGDQTTLVSIQHPGGGGRK